MLEYERKYMLTPAEYTELCALFNKPVRTHINYYFDTDTYAYNKKGITCRIRQIENRFVATVKNHHVSQTDCSEELSAVVEGEWDMSFFRGMPVLPQGTLVTERMEIVLADSLQLAVDKNRYLGTTDYELEMEYTPLEGSTGEERLTCLIEDLQNADIKTVLKSIYMHAPADNSKSERFFARKIRGLKRSDVYAVGAT